MFLFVLFVENVFTDKSCKTEAELLLLKRRINHIIYIFICAYNRPYSQINRILFLWGAANSSTFHFTYLLLLSNISEMHQYCHRNIVKLIPGSGSLLGCGIFFLFKHSYTAANIWSGGLF